VITDDAPGDVEAARVRQGNVEEHELWPELPGNCDGGRAVPRLPDDVEAFELEERAGSAPKARMIVDDNHRDRHETIVTQPETAR
jgi:hypothetical protein